MVFQMISEEDDFPNHLENVRLTCKDFEKLVLYFGVPGPRLRRPFYGYCVESDVTGRQLYVPISHSAHQLTCYDKSPHMYIYAPQAVWEMSRVE
jgi:hypothetical protein